MTRCHIATAAALLALAPAFATAQERILNFELGAGLRYAPIYEGADEYETGPTGTGSLGALQLGSINIQPGSGTGFGFAPSFRFVGERTADDTPILDGIDDVDAAFELGAKLSYRWENAEVFAAVRKGLTGHDGVVGDLGADAIIPLDAQTTLRVGPRLSFANGEYMDTYFSVPATATALAAHDADAGMKSAGIEMTLRRDISDAWAVQGTLGWSRLSDNVAESPIVKDGSRDQGSFSMMLVRKFNLRF
ncbi:MipA/OmpV family protein [Thalassococcus sp. CAU 1522]|uniref:MipA/OmpV family protein n=1 Tax=Thalassococcus arenae TaxID=2851652 RepID=A0ABS6N7M8_9RHOB|nr:MipA/OmpV family protein [Thalassococcus arenae]MBV2359672.1 MipA/OmpV family protein [Thalassococcus arenae]